MTLRIGTRGSRLALAQTALAQSALMTMTQTDTEAVQITTRGDRIQDRPLSALGGNGAFVRGIERALAAGEIDLAVHSAKDLPVQLADGMEIAAVLPRADFRDVLVMRRGCVPEGAFRIGTGSLRRRRFLARRYPAAEFADIRGNVDTRLRRLAAGEFDALVLAAAGLERLGRFTADFAYEMLDPADCLPAACQGIIALECRADSETAALLHAISDAETMYCFEAERHLLTLLGGDCSIPAGALAETDGARMRLRFSRDGVQIAEGEAAVAERFALAERLFCGT